MNIDFDIHQIIYLGVKTRTNCPQEKISTWGDNMREKRAREKVREKGIEREEERERRRQRAKEREKKRES